MQLINLFLKPWILCEWLAQVSRPSRQTTWPKVKSHCNLKLVIATQANTTSSLLTRTVWMECQQACKSHNFTT
eukprot:455734-Pelagomonas_calceolata.AAC.1